MSYTALQINSVCTHGDDGCEVNHMLTSFTLKNFKSFKEATLHLTPTVTFLIGANGSGKTNALEALRFISWLGQGQAFSYIEKNLAKKDSTIRGTMGDLFRKGTDLLTIGFEIEEHGRCYSLSEEIATSIFDDCEKTLPRFSVNTEKLYDEKNKKEVFSVDVNSTSKNETYTLKSGTKIRTELSNGLEFYDRIIFYEKIILQSIQEVIEKKKKTELISELKKVKAIYNKCFSSICFLNFNPIKMRDYVPQRGYIQFEEDGSNLSEVLQNLCRDNIIKAKIIEIIRSLPEQDIKDINFMNTEDGDVRLALLEQLTTCEQKMSVKLLSDGTLRALAIAAALYGAPKGSFLIIEEVDNGIHPSRIKHLVDKMYEIAAERKIQILVTTHDPAMMNAIPPQEKGNVLCCYRSKEDGTSKILRLSDSPHADSIIIGQKLGDYVTTEQFDSQIKDTRSAQEVHEDQMKWLEQFRQAVLYRDKEAVDGQ